MVDPLGLVYEGKAGTGAAAIAPQDDALTGALLEQIKRKGEKEKLKKASAIKAFKPLGTPWDRDEADIATNREKLGKRSGELLMTNPKFMYQADSPEYQEFMGMYNELKEDIDFSKQHAAVYKDLMDKASSGTGLKYFDFDKTMAEYSAWADLPLADRKKHPLPMPTLKEETFDPDLYISTLMAPILKYPEKGSKTVNTAYGKKDISYTYIPENDMRRMAVIASQSPEFKEWGQSFYDDATETQRADLEKLTRDNGFERVEEYLAYDKIKPLGYYQETGKSSYMPIGHANKMDEESYIDWILAYSGRMIRGDADMYSEVPNEQGFLVKEGTDFTNRPIGTFIKLGKKESIFATGYYYDPKNRNFYRSTNVSDEDAKESGNPKDRYELIHSETQGIDNTFSMFISPIVQNMKNVKEAQVYSYIDKNKYFKDRKKGIIDWQTLSPKEEIETYEQRKTRQDIINRRDDITERIRSQAKNVKYTEYGFWGGSISDTDKRTVDNINAMLKNLVISYKKEGRISVSKYESPQLEWEGLIVGGSDLKLKTKDGEVLAVIKNQEQIDEILENATTKEEEKLVGVRDGGGTTQKPTFK